MFLNTILTSWILYTRVVAQSEIECPFDEVKMNPSSTRSITRTLRAVKSKMYTSRPHIAPHIILALDLKPIKIHDYTAPI
jgi:hypothetical protein